LIAITADDSITKKFPVLEDGPLEVAVFWHTQFDELAQLKNFNAANKFNDNLRDKKVIRDVNMSKLNNEDVIEVACVFGKEIRCSDCHWI
jgi:hypothetical protein